MKLDAFHYHEALDRATVVADLVESALVEHPVIKKHKTCRLLADKALESLAALAAEVVRLDEITADEQAAFKQKR